MGLNFTAQLFQQSWMKIIRVLFISSEKKRCLRELVDLTGLSVGGVQDVLRRLEEQELISSSRQGKRVYYTLKLAPEERELLGSLIGLETKRELKKRGEYFSRRRVAAIDWIDETIGAISMSRQVYSEATRAS